MNIKIKSKQIYEDHEESFEEIYEDYKIKLLDKNIVINYNGVEIIFHKEKNVVEIKRKENNIFIELNKENESVYETPYGKMIMRTYGEKISIEEKPFILNIKYKITLGNVAEYKNIIEILEF